MTNSSYIESRKDGAFARIWSSSNNRQRIILIWLLVNLPLQIALKYADVLSSHEQQTTFKPKDEYPGWWPRGRQVRDAIVEPLKGRLDDASFWMQVAVTVACWRVLRANAELPGPRLAARAPWILIALLCIVYIACEAVEPGTFFALRHTRISTIAQWIEGTAYLGVIAASASAAADGVAIAAALDSINPDGLRTVRERLVSGAAAPLWGFSVYFFASQVITGANVTNSEWMAAIAAILSCSLPYCVLLYRCVTAWEDRFDVRPTVLNPFGIAVIAIRERRLEEPPRRR